MTLISDLNDQEGCTVVFTILFGTLVAWVLFKNAGQVLCGKTEDNNNRKYFHPSLILIVQDIRRHINNRLHI